MAFSRKRPGKKPFDFAKRSAAALASLSGKTADGKRVKPAKPVQKRPEEHGEKCLHMHCQQWLVKSGLWGRLLIFHVANERKGSVGAAMHFKRMGVRPGVADYLAFGHGVALAIELKDEDGGQDPEQEKFQARWEAAGNAYVLVRSLAEFQGAVQALTLFA